MTTGVEINPGVDSEEEFENSSESEEELGLKQEEKGETDDEEADVGDDDDEDVAEPDRDDEGARDDSGEDRLSGWADSIARILKTNKPKNKKELILSRARKDYEVNKSIPKNTTTRYKNKPDTTLEIVPSSKKPKSEIKDEDEKKTVDDKADNILSLKVQRKLELKQKKLELAWENLARLNTEKTDPQLERDLLKIATKGVVQLFNAISMQQKTIKTKLKTTRKSEFKKDKVLEQTKDIFDDAMLKVKILPSTNSNPISKKIKVKKESTDDEEDEESAEEVNTVRKRKSSTKKMSSNKKPCWNALEDDYMLDATIKDWDKGSDSD